MVLAAHSQDVTTLRSLGALMPAGNFAVLGLPATRQNVAPKTAPAASGAMVLAYLLQVKAFAETSVATTKARAQPVFQANAVVGWLHAVLTMASAPH